MDTSKLTGAAQQAAEAAKISAAAAKVAAQDGLDAIKEKVAGTPIAGKAEGLVDKLKDKAADVLDFISDKAGDLSDKLK